MNNVRLARIDVSKVLALVTQPGPIRGAALLMRGDTYIESKMYAKGIDDYSNAIEDLATATELVDQMRLVSALHNRAHAYRHISKFELAIKDLTSSIGLVRSLATMKHITGKSELARGLCYVQTRQLDLAKMDFEFVLGKDTASSMHADALVGLARISEIQKRTLNAIEYLTRALEMDPTHNGVFSLKDF
jgi:tetratricopeptide (TPR) repeat protein